MRDGADRLLTVAYNTDCHCYDSPRMHSRIIHEGNHRGRLGHNQKAHVSSYIRFQHEGRPNRWNKFLTAADINENTQHVHSGSRGRDDLSMHYFRLGGAIVTALSGNSLPIVI